MRTFAVWFANALRVAYGDSIANAGRRVTDEQRKAIFAKRGGGGGGGGGGRSQNSRPPAAVVSLTSTPLSGGIGARDRKANPTSWSIAAPGGLAEAQAQTPSGSEPAAPVETVVPAGGGQITAEGTGPRRADSFPTAPKFFRRCLDPCPDRVHTSR
jgi:hypothetical protein